jgi:hypothetical protein
MKKVLFYSLLVVLVPFSLFIAEVVFAGGGGPMEILEAIHISDIKVREWVPLEVSVFGKLEGIKNVVVIMNYGRFFGKTYNNLMATSHDSNQKEYKGELNVKEKKIKFKIFFDRAGLRDAICAIRYTTEKGEIFETAGVKIGKFDVR